MNPMAQLKDIHLPQEVGLWPLAWGWWLLILVLIVVFALSIAWLIKRHQRRLAQRQSLKQLQQISAQQKDWPQQINALLKRAAMVYFPAGSVEPLHSAGWVTFLTDALPASKRVAAKESFTSLQASLYQRNPKEADFSSIQGHAIEWIKCALPPSNKQLEEAKHV